jgi:hypothetical protein
MNRAEEAEEERVLLTLDIRHQLHYTAMVQGPARTSRSFVAAADLLLAAAAADAEE